MEREIEVDGQLAPAQQRLDAVVHALVDAVPVWDGGGCRWTESVYARLRQALRGRQGAGGVCLVAGSRAPCSIAALDLTVAVDTCARNGGNRTVKAPLTGCAAWWIGVGDRKTWR